MDNILLKCTCLTNALRRSITCVVACVYQMTSIGAGENSKSHSLSDHRKLYIEGCVQLVLLVVQTEFDLWHLWEQHRAVESVHVISMIQAKL